MNSLTRSQILVGVGIISLLGILCVLVTALVVLGVDQANVTSQVNTLSSNMTAQANNEAATLEPEIAATVRAEFGSAPRLSGTFPARTPGAGRR